MIKRKLVLKTKIRLCALRTFFKQYSTSQTNPRKFISWYTPWIGLKYHIHTLSIAGQLLCGGLFSGDKLSNWFSAVGVAHGLMDQEEIKQDLLRVQLSTSTANTPVSLMQQVMAVVIKTGQVQTRLGLLMLIRCFLQLGDWKWTSRIHINLQVLLNYPEKKVRGCVLVR